MKSVLVLLSALAMGCKPTSASVSEPAPSAASAASASEPTPSKPACEPLRVELPPLEHLDGDPPVPPVVDPNHHAMEPFYRRWAELLRGQAKDHLRIAVYGDSNGTMDFMTGAMRRALQGKYGDAGHGYVSIGQPWNWYRHRDVKVTLMTGTWESFTVTTKPVLDGFYGQALIMAESLQNGATAWISTADADAPVGTRATSLEVYFLRGPRGGVFDVMADGVRLATVDTSAKEHAAGFERVSVADGPHKFALVARSTKRVRIFGVVLEREPPSVQVDGLGVGSLNCLCMLRDAPVINKAVLAHRKYDLVIFHIGSNTFHAMTLGACMKQVIARHREALPGVPLLIMTPPDFLGSRSPPTTVSWLVDVCKEQRKIAEENGTAFFDFHEAMGGNGSMERFQAAKLTQGDFVHFNEPGGALMGHRVLVALYRDFADWAKQHPETGCAPSSPQ